MASQITSLTIVYSAVCSGADQRKHQSSCEFPAQRASNAENISIWWRHDDDAILVSVECSVPDAFFLFCLVSVSEDFAHSPQSYIPVICLGQTNHTTTPKWKQKILTKSTVKWHISKPKHNTTRPWGYWWRNSGVLAMELRLCCTNPSIYIADTVCTDISMVQYKTITSIVLAHLLCDILFCTKHWLVICELAAYNKFCENIEAVYWKTISIIGVCYTEHGHMLAVITFMIASWFCSSVS